MLGCVFIVQNGKSSISSECSPKSYHPESCNQHFGSSPSLKVTHLANETLNRVPAGIMLTGFSNPLNFILLHPLLGGYWYRIPLYSLRVKSLSLIQNPTL